MYSKFLVCNKGKGKQLSDSTLLSGEGGTLYIFG